MSDLVLVLSNPSDEHATRVASHIAANGASCTFVDGPLLCSSARLSFEIDQGSSQGRLTFSDNFNLNFQDVCSVWNRRVGTPGLWSLPSPPVHNQPPSEAGKTLAGVMRALSCLWVNHPGRQEETHLKLWQLDLARQVGLVVPPTLVTNVPEQVLAFYEQCEGEMVYKQIDEGSGWLFPLFEVRRALYTMPFRESDLAHVQQVRHGLHLFQRQIRKICDLRITVVAEKVFSVRIESQLGNAKLDWRHDVSVPHRLYTLPGSVEESCIKLVRELGLNYGAIDFVLTPEGEHIFLEINPAGEFLWMEDCLKLDISKELALLLTGKSKPLVPRVVPDVE